MPVLRARADRVRRERHRVRARGDRSLESAGVAVREEPRRQGAGARGGHARPAGVARDHGVPRGSLPGARAVAGRSRAARARAAGVSSASTTSSAGTTTRFAAATTTRSPSAWRRSILRRTDSRRSRICRGSCACATGSASSCRRGSPRGSSEVSERPAVREELDVVARRSEHRRAVRAARRPDVDCHRRAHGGRIRRYARQRVRPAPGPHSGRAQSRHRRAHALRDGRAGAGARRPSARLRDRGVLSQRLALRARRPDPHRRRLRSVELRRDRGTSGRVRTARD